ncbi:MAG: hypothetical protein MUP90_18430 [Gammaproteobacteria bacterium]|nr:hypothetical protein [Gammaproteobacteria bacterium]
MRSKLILAMVLYLGGLMPSYGQEAGAALAHSIEQLRSSIGFWNVTTELLNPDANVSESIEGTYEFVWVIPDRVVSGKSVVPGQNQVSAILFYVSERKGTIEMLSVGADGNLWIMTGPLGGEERRTQAFKTQGGGSGQLKFTRYNVLQDSFESKMEYTEDGGKTWKPGNHQLFRRSSQ